MMSEESKQEAQAVEYYAAQVNAWVNTRFELDKSLLTLSAGGVGLLVTLISTLGVRTVESLILYLFALFWFVVCLACILWIFKRNSHHLEAVVSGNDDHDPLLKYLDVIAISTFCLGVVFSSIIGISTAIHSLQEKEKQMTDNKVASASSPQMAFDSVNGISAMASTNRVNQSASTAQTASTQATSTAQLIATEKNKP